MCIIGILTSQKPLKINKRGGDILHSWKDCIRSRFELFTDFDEEWVKNLQKYKCRIGSSIFTATRK